ncbi:MAG: thiamine pyrophosphate-dependent enzyme [Chitinophagaceae bacterium]
MVRAGSMKKGDWKDLTKAPQSSSDISPTAGQMVRALGMAYASKLYRNVPELKNGFEKFTRNGDEVIFCTIGDASTSEGLFWETINAAGVLRVPLAVFVWDDGYGISVPRRYQTTKNSISQALSGMQWDEETGGIHIETIKGWDYADLVSRIQKGIARIRETHVPTIFHIQEVTQPQGHSTSGSHERYKSKDRLQFEKDMDCIVKMREFIVSNEIADEDTLTQHGGRCKAGGKRSEATRMGKIHYSYPRAGAAGGNTVQPDSNAGACFRSGYRSYGTETYGYQRTDP